MHSMSIMPAELLALNLAISLAVMSGLWIVAAARRDVSIVDLYWGAGFAVITWMSFWGYGGAAPRQWLISLIVSAWAMRLTLYLYLRGRGKGEDPRYAAMRARRGAAFKWQSLYIVFGLQGALQWLISLPVQIGLQNSGPAGAWEIAGAVLALGGLWIESVADQQLARFKRNPLNAGKILDYGLWAYSRHPNYFGELLYGWGIFVISAGDPLVWWTSIGPAVMTFLLLRVSGVRLLEQRLQETKPHYREYAARTPVIIPFLSFWK